MPGRQEAASLSSLPETCTRTSRFRLTVLCRPCAGTCAHCRNCVSGMRYRTLDCRVTAVEYASIPAPPRHAPPALPPALQPPPPDWSPKAPKREERRQPCPDPRRQSVLDLGTLDRQPLLKHSFKPIWTSSCDGGVIEGGALEFHDFWASGCQAGLKVPPLGLKGM